MTASIFLCCFILHVNIALVCAFSRHDFFSKVRTRSVMSEAKKSWSPEPESSNKDIEDGFSYTIELSKSAGISWGADLSFRFVYVVDVDPLGEAAQAGVIKKGDYIVEIGNVTTLGMQFDAVLKTLSEQESRFNYTFFRGRKDQMVGTAVSDPSETIVTVKVIQDGKKDIYLKCPGGTNLRNVLVNNGINVYRSLARWTNCNGKQLCGTCIIDVVEGGESCSRKALNEENILAENPESYRLSCRTAVYGDVTVKVQGPVGASQWTR